MNKINKALFTENPTEVNFDRLMSSQYKKENQRKILQNLNSPNDLRLKGFNFRGEGKADEEALNQIREQVINFKE